MSIKIVGTSFAKATEFVIDSLIKNNLISPDKNKRQEINMSANYKLEAEPTNPFDSKAVMVKIWDNQSKSWRKVGYLPKNSTAKDTLPQDTPLSGTISGNTALGNLHFALDDTPIGHMPTTNDPY